MFALCECKFYDLPEIAVLVGRGLLGTGDVILEECGVVGSIEHLRSTIYGFQLNMSRLLYVNANFII